MNAAKTKDSTANDTGIIKGFNLDEIRKRRARLNASNGVSLIDGINAIDSRIGELKPTETIKVAVPKDMGKRKMVMQIVAKLSNLTAKGGDWAGRKFDVVQDPQDDVVWVQRGADVTPKERKRGTGGGRPAASSEPANTATA